MRPVLYVLTFLSVMGLAFWAYRENYATQQALKDMAALQDDIAALREALTLQRAEWAYLNRPERLRQLATLNFDRLGLFPLTPEQLGAARDIAYPPQVPLMGSIDDPQDVIGQVAPDGDFP
jgi:hypothetical protein